MGTHNRQGRENRSRPKGERPTKRLKLPRAKTGQGQNDPIADEIPAAEGKYPVAYQTSAGQNDQVAGKILCGGQGKFPCRTNKVPCGGGRNTLPPSNFRGQAAAFKLSRVKATQLHLRRREKYPAAFKLPRPNCRLQTFAGQKRPSCNLSLASQRVHQPQHSTEKCQGGRAERQVLNDHLKAITSKHQTRKERKRAPQCHVCSHKRELPRKRIPLRQARLRAIA